MLECLSVRVLECEVGRFKYWKGVGLEGCRIGRVYDWKGV